MSETFQEAWPRILGFVSLRVSEDTFERWFSQISAVESDASRIVLSAPNQIYQFWIETNYLPILTEAIETILGSRRRIEFTFRDPDMLDSPPPATDPKPAPAKKRTGRRAKGHSMDELVIHAGLNQRYRFDTFVVGANNEFAHAACHAAALNPGRTYNPLFIYGGAGLGKTHLMHAIGHSILKERPESKVVYITSERFTNEFIEAIGGGSIVKFRQRYREADVLLIDDIQFFAGKDRSQEEFFHTFNSLCDANGKQIVMTSDHPASKIKNLESRLVSRFEWGMTAELAPPDTETRIAILQRKMQEWRVKVDSGLIQFLAERIRNNVRRLEGALLRLASYSSMNNLSLDMRSAEKLLQDVLHDEAAKDVTIPQIQKRVADFFDVRLNDILGRKRPAQIALARQVAMFFSRELTNASYQEIGDAFGGRDHGTVIHACRAVEAKRQKNETVKRQVDRLYGELSEASSR